MRRPAGLAGTYHAPAPPPPLPRRPPCTPHPPSAPPSAPQDIIKVRKAGGSLAEALVAEHMTTPAIVIPRNATVQQVRRGA